MIQRADFLIDNFHGNTQKNRFFPFGLIVKRYFLKKILDAPKKNNIWSSFDFFHNNFDSAFYLWKITEVGNSYLKLFHFDGTGKWEEEYRCP